MIGTRTLLLVSTLALAGCSLAPKTVLPTPPVPQSWPVGDAYLLQSEAALPILSYQSVFTDARLQSLAEQALTNNRDLRVAYANVAAARAIPTVMVRAAAAISRCAAGSPRSNSTCSASSPMRPRPTATARWRPRPRRAPCGSR